MIFIWLCLCVLFHLTTTALTHAYSHFPLPLLHKLCTRLPEVHQRRRHGTRGGLVQPVSGQRDIRLAQGHRAHQHLRSGKFRCVLCVVCIFVIFSFANYCLDCYYWCFRTKSAQKVSGNAESLLQTVFVEKPAPGATDSATATTTDAAPTAPTAPQTGTSAAPLQQQQQEAAQPRVKMYQLVYHNFRAAWHES